MADIGAKLKLEGEAEFKRGLNDAKTATSALNSEMKLAEEQFKATGDKETYMKERAKLLNDQIAAQEKAVEAAKKALAECAKNGLDENATKTLEWRKKLADAQTKLVSLNTELENNKKGLDANGKSLDAMTGKVDGATTASGKMEAALDSINKNVSLQNVSDAIGKINGAIDAGIRKAVQMGRALWDITSDATDWADDLATKATKTGIDAETLQQWDYAARFIDTDVDAIIMARNKLLRGIGTESVDSALEAMGVSATDAEGKMRDAYDVMWDVLGAMQGMDETERDKAAMEFFGRSFSDLVPLIEAGREAWDSYANRAPVVSGDDLDKLTEANDALEDLDARFETTKRTLLAQLAPALQAVAEALSDALTQLNAYLATEEGQAQMQRFSDTVAKLATDLFNIDWAAAIQGAASAFETITDVFQWLIDNKEVIIGVLAAIAAAKIWGTLSSAASSAGKLWLGLKGLTGLGAAGAAGAAGASGAGATATTAAATAATAASGSGTMLSALGSVAPGLIGTALGIAALVGFTDLVNGEDYQINTDVEKTTFTPERAEAIDEGLRVLSDTAQDGENSIDDARAALDAMAKSAGSVEEFFRLFDSVDKDRGEINLLADIMESDREGSGQLAALVADVLAARFGDYDTAGGAAQMNALNERERNALRQAYTHRQTILATNGGKLGLRADTGIMSAAMLSGYFSQFLQEADNAYGWQTKRTGETAENSAELKAVEHLWHVASDDLGQYLKAVDPTTGLTVIYDPSSGQILNADWRKMDPAGVGTALKEDLEDDYIQLLIKSMQAGGDGEGGSLYQDLLDGMLSQLSLTRTKAESNSQGDGSDWEDYAAALTASLSQVKIQMNGRDVGVLITPTVQEILARQMAERR